MRYTYWLVFVLCFVPNFAIITAMAEEPYIAVITTDWTTVYGGPGSGYYPTSQLRIGDKVEVHFVQGEWCAIRPPIGSFSWVSAHFVDCGTGNVGTVLAEGLASRIGSDFSDDCDTVQVKLKKGESILILERREMPENPASPVWLKIVPPCGEFRWIHRLTLGTPIQQVRYDAPAAEIAELPKSPTVSVPFPKAFSELQREAYAAMTQPTADEVFASLIQRAEELHRVAVTDQELEKTYHLFESLQRTRIVRRDWTLRRQAAIGAYQTLPLPNSGMANPRPTNSGTLAPRQPIVPAYTPTAAQIDTFSLRAGVNVGGFDIVGRLGEFDPLPKGHPPYAVVDEKEQIICLISPSANLDLSPYVGQFIGINGVLGLYEEPGKPSARHIFAKNIRKLR
jgi:hypothetical protein